MRDVFLFIVAVFLFAGFLAGSCALATWYALENFHGP